MELIIEQENNGIGWEYQPADFDQKGLDSVSWWAIQPEHGTGLALPFTASTPRGVGHMAVSVRDNCAIYAYGGEKPLTASRSAMLVNG
ncbi:MAG: hypothetical protein HKM24_07535, partial [Gammaproteobacteria bacterium]|nr:hypothetical protein [Gammaproteobacteria bacterium]